MIYAVICAGGIGSRMGNRELPKQYMLIDGKPIIVHTVEKFLINSNFEEVLVLCPSSWQNYTEELFAKYIPSDANVKVLCGGESRNDTIMNAVSYIEQQGNLHDDTIIVTHDAVRPFVTARIIEQNIREAIKFGATDTVVSATDTIVCSGDGETISHIPNRAEMYQGQTPQSFNAKKLKKLFESLGDDEKSVLTDACKIFALKGEKVKLVQGEVYNIKITYPYDLRVAKTLLNEEEGTYHA